MTYARFYLAFAALSAAGVLWGCSRNDEEKAGKGGPAKDAATNGKQHRHDAEQAKPRGDHVHHGHSSEAGDKLIVPTRPAEPEARKKTTLRLMIHAADGTMLRDFDLVHEKKIHLIIVHEALKHFDHVHAEIDPRGNISIDHTFPVGGKYRLFVDYQPKGKSPTTAKAEFAVMGAGPALEQLKPDVPGNVQGGALSAEITVEDAKDHAKTIVFDLRQENGQAAEALEPYLGAMGHLVVVSADGKQYVHAHPLDEKLSGSKVRFEAHFPGPGLYKGWGQFLHGHELDLIPFVIEVR